MQDLLAWDIETFPNICTFGFLHIATSNQWMFEISDRRNDLVHLLNYLSQVQQCRWRMVGFNSVGFDYPVTHDIITGKATTYQQIYAKAQTIIDADWNDRFLHTVYPSDYYIPQIDLMLIHHFDNANRRTSLKMLEFNMRSDSIQDLPYEPGTILNDVQKDVLIKYNWKDINETADFAQHSLDKIQLRDDLSSDYPIDFTNFNDTKIGKQIFIHKLEKTTPGSCFAYVNGKKQPRQSPREKIHFKDIILPYINFERPEFQSIHRWLYNFTATKTKEVLNDITYDDTVFMYANHDLIHKKKATLKHLHTVVDGFQFDFGTGGIHGSVDSQTIIADDHYAIIDIDVISFYPREAIVNKLKPEHFGPEFSDIFNGIFEDRQKYPKETHKSRNTAYKLALNGGGFGASNDKHSPFFDPQYFLSITVNGQLLLCMLSEQLMKIPELTMIQVNTDGVTVKCPRNYVEHLNNVCKWWEQLTGLELEQVFYSRMFIKNVSNYIAEDAKTGKLKNKGVCYTHENLDWSKNFGGLIIPKAAEHALVHGVDPEHFIRNHNNIHDFMLRTKVDKSEQVTLDGIPQQRISRYYVSTDGGELLTVKPPVKPFKVGMWKKKQGVTNDQYFRHLNYSAGSWCPMHHTKNQSKYETRYTNLQKGRLCTVCNDISTARWDNIDYDYYIVETKKLVDPLR